MTYFYIISLLLDHRIMQSKAHDQECILKIKRFTLIHKKIMTIKNEETSFE
jgi:hypothetical protein